jgi:hypothetical protein
MHLLGQKFTVVLSFMKRERERALYVPDRYCFLTRFSQILEIYNEKRRNRYKSHQLVSLKTSFQMNPSIYGSLTSINGRFLFRILV